LCFNKKEKKSKAYLEPQGKSQKAILHYSFQRREKNRFLIDLELVTGRKHQIRSQLSAIGAPILGDIKYGFPEKFKEGAIALEAYYLSFSHPTTKEKLEFLISEEQSSVLKDVLL
jgi:23S rRNA pseudouridine1911/1915/1917 synthase